MASIILLFLNLFFLMPNAVAGLDKYSYLDSIEDWVIERRINSSTNKTSCRASIPGYWTWFGARIRLNKQNELVVPSGFSKSQIPSTSTIKKVKSALKTCREDLLYFFER